MADYPKFQYSYFINNGAQVVVRGEDAEEWIADIATAQEAYPLTTTAKTSTPATTTPSGAMCAVHNKELKEKISKSTGKPYKAHFRKVGEEWDICFGKGWQSEKEGDTVKEVQVKINKPKPDETLDEDKDVNPNDIPF